ncbi:dormancy-associated protein 1-like [Tasmannia lanceolata]|uniref:dormancy-associated protein 1-like n=1 Tax=Tasmannia lanceolata TaxID=3420 RepID=UPI0040640859
MVLLDKLWDDVLAGPHPDHGLDQLRRVTTKPLAIMRDELDGSKKFQRSVSMPGTPGTPTTPVTPNSPSTSRKDNVWRSVFNPGSNLATKKIGAHVFDKPQPNSPTVYDWLYSGDTKSTHR